MPELPEVETTRRGISPALSGQRIRQVIVRDKRLRWPIPDDMARNLEGSKISAVTRRAKYLLVHTDRGTAIIHLGMSGSLRIVQNDSNTGKHDHYDLLMTSGDVIRFNDPRRFGCFLWAGDLPEQHPLLLKLGPEPLSEAFNTDYLFQLSRKRKVAIKQFLMNSSVVAGVGNIYASEALFRAGINPRRAAGRVSRPRMEKIVHAIKAVLNEAINMGGTTLRDFRNSDGKPGYFRIRLQVYGHAGEPCPRCKGSIKQIVQGQRSTFYCSSCQT
ncbi:MAG: bifunctional DNA-formamidopyrimidine glycosylase/DNA-(apurinic or apyrimidinic site) lyase [Gammaproteobacteria bacterium]